MTTALITHEAFDGHVTPDGHPERVERLHAVAEALAVSRFADLDRRLAPLASVETVKRAHPGAYVEWIAQSARRAGPGPSPLDADTSICEGSWEAALRASGAVTMGVDVASISKKPTIRPATIQPRVPNTRIGGKSCCGSSI